MRKITEKEWNERIALHMDRRLRLFETVYELKKEGKCFTEIVEYVKGKPELTRGLLYRAIISSYISLINKISYEEIVKGIKESRY